MEIKLINVSEEHWDFILSLRNEFFKHSFYEQKHAISKDEHYEYMKKQTTNPNFHQWIAIQSKNSTNEKIFFANKFFEMKFVFYFKFIPRLANTWIIIIM